MSGPTGAMTVVLVPIIATYGAHGVLVVGLLAGLILIGLGYAGAGRFIRYVPIPVVEGFTVGIGVIIALQQVPSALGVDVHADERRGARSRRGPRLAAGPGLGTARDGDRRGAARAGAGARAAALAGRSAGRGGRRGRQLRVRLGGRLDRSHPLAAARLRPCRWCPPASWAHLILPALAVAALAALESLLSATVADAMSVGGRHDSNRELIGQGLANLGAPLFGGIPATAAIARTAVNVRSGASSRLAALIHSAVLLLLVLVGARWVGEIPLAALAGVLVATAAQMVKVSSVAALLRSTRGDAAVLAVTAVATVALDLVTAVLIGLVVAGFFALQQTARSASFDEVPLDGGDHADEERSLVDEHIVAYRIDGPLFFAVAHDFLLELADVTDVRVVVLRLSRVTTIDATGAHVLADTISRLERRHITVLLSGVQPAHEKVLRQLGVYDGLAARAPPVRDDSRGDHACAPACRAHRARVGRRDGLAGPSGRPDRRGVRVRRPGATASTGPSRSRR